MILRTTPFLKKLFLSGLLFVLLVPLFYAVTKVGVKYYRQEQCANYLFYSLTDTLFAIHPFVSDGEYALVLPSFWRNEELMVKYAQKVVPLEHIKDDVIKVTNSQSGGGTLFKVRKSHAHTVFINTESGTMENIDNSADKTVSEGGLIKVISNQGCVSYDGKLKKIRGRGNSTWNCPIKKPYNINIGKSVELLEMHKGKKYCLLSNNTDRSNSRESL